MTFRRQCWLVFPLAAALGCAGSQQAQKETKAGANSTLVDEGPAAPAGQGAATAGAATAGAQLVPFQGANGYSVLMPANPQRDDRTQQTPGGPVQVHIAQAQDVTGKYMSSLSEFPKGSLDKVKSKDLLDSLQQATIQSMGGTLVKSEDIQVGGLPGREFTATDPEGSEVTARVFVGGSSVYTLAGTYPKGQMPAPMQQFLGSFQPPAGTAVGGSGTGGTTDGSAAATALNNASSGAASANGANTGDSVSGSSPDSATVTPAAPSKKTQKKSRRSTTSSTMGESDARPAAVGQ